MANLLQNIHDERENEVSKILKQLKNEIEIEEQASFLPDLRKNPSGRVLKNVLDFSKSIHGLSFKNHDVPSTYSSN